jgi:hypothetical protein
MDIIQDSRCEQAIKISFPKDAYLLNPTTVDKLPRKTGAIGIVASQATAPGHLWVILPTKHSPLLLFSTK